MTQGSAVRLGGHLGLSSPDKPLLAPLGRSVGAADQIAALAAHGFAGVQDLGLMFRPATERAAMARALRAAGMVLSSTNGDGHNWNTPLWSRSDAEGRELQAASVAGSAGLARAFGGLGTVCVAGLDPDRPRSAQLADMAEALRRVAEPAAEAGLTMLVEPIAEARIPGMLLAELEHGVEVVAAVAMPSVRLLFDTGHVAMMGHDVPRALMDCAGLTGLVQVADVSGSERLDPGLGTLDWAAVVGALGAIGYGGVVELEYEPADWSAAGVTAMLARLAALFPGFTTPCAG